MQPASSSSFTAAKPTEGRNRSTRQVTKRATRRGGELDTPATMALAAVGYQYDGLAAAHHAAGPVCRERAAAEENVAARRPLDGSPRVLGDQQAAIDLERARAA